MNFLLIQRYIIYISFISCVSNEEIYSSVAQLEDLFKFETDLVPLLENYLKIEYSKLEEIQTRLNDLDTIPENQESFDEYLSHPINQFNLIKQMAYHKWDAIEELVKSDNSLELLEHLNKNDVVFPTTNDLEGSARALLRLQQTYQLDTTVLAKGILKDFKSRQPLTVEECYYIASIAYDIGDFHHCQLWMAHVLTFNLNDSLPFSEFEVLDYLTHCSSEAGNFKAALLSTSKMLKIEPGSYYVENMYKDLQRISEREKHQPSQNKGKFIDENYERLCRNQAPELPVNVERQLKCYYWTNNKQARLLFSPAKLEELYPWPHIVRFHDIISEREVEVLQNISKPKLHRSTVTKIRTSANEVVNSRVSKSAVLTDSHPIVKRISQRIEDVTGLTTDTAESLMTTSYGVGGQYEPHTDYLAANKELDPMDIDGNRIATFLLYLTDVPHGGSTVFLIPQIAVPPIKGSAVFWYNLHPNGEGDKRTRHASCPVLIGNKWIANKWIHERGQEFVRKCTLQYSHRVF